MLKTHGCNPNKNHPPASTTGARTRDADLDPAHGKADILLQRGPQAPPRGIQGMHEEPRCRDGGSLGDGCGEFMPSPSAADTDPTSLKCAACGCHRNFHRREPDLDHPPAVAIEYQPHHRHRPPAPETNYRGSPSSSSPPPISSSYAPHMLLGLSTGSEPSSTRKRHRTKFSPGQKEQMFRFAERVGWKMMKRDDDLVREFCDEVKVDKGVFKVWMHNNKNTFVKRVLLDAGTAVVTGSNGVDDDKITNKSNGTSENNINNNHHNEDEDGIDRREHQFRLGVAGGASNVGSSSS